MLSEHSGLEVHAQDDGLLDRDIEMQVEEPIPAPTPPPRPVPVQPALDTVSLGDPDDLPGDVNAWRATWAGEKFKFRVPARIQETRRQIVHALGLQTEETDKVPESSSRPAQTRSLFADVPEFVAKPYVVVPMDPVTVSIVSRDAKEILGGSTTALGASTFAKKFPMAARDERECLTPQKIDPDAIAYIKSWINPDFNPLKPFGNAAPHLSPPGLRAGMGAPHVRRVGAPDDQDGLPHRIHGPVLSDLVSNVDQDPGKGEPPSRYGDGPPENARKTSYKDRRPSAGRARFLLFPLFSGEEIRRLEAHFKPEGIKRRGKTPVVQNGYPSVRPSFTRRGYPPIPDSKYAGLGSGHVGRLSRLRGRLLPCRDRSSRQEISEVRVRRYRLRVPSLAVRPFYGPKNVYTSSAGRRRLPQDMRGQSVPISGRLARRRGVIRPNPTIPIPGPHLRPGNRVPLKQGEIRLGPDPVPVLPRLQPGPSQGSGS